jgi:hypothetical protein
MYLLRAVTSNPGTIDEPLQTIIKVRDVVPTVNSNMTGDIYVYLRGEDYRITSTITFGPEDSGTNGYRIYYQAYQGETPYPQLFFFSFNL